MRGRAVEEVLGVGAATAARIRSAMFGSATDGIRVERQAWRTTDTDSDELALLCVRGSWWVARRISDRLSVWAYAGDDEADTGFERRMAEAGGSWTEAAGEPLAG